MCSNTYSFRATITVACALFTAVVFPPSRAHAQLFSDNFDSVPNGQPSPNWINHNGANFVVTNPTGTAGTFDATNPSNSPLILATINGLSVGDFTFDFDIGSARDGGAVARFQDTNNFALLVVKAETSSLYWHVMQGGVLSPIISPVGLPIAAGTAVHVRITGTGSTLSATVSQLGSFFTSTLSSVPFATGGLGLYDYALGSGVPLRFDNVVVAASAPEPGTLALLSFGVLGGIAARRRTK